MGKSILKSIGIGAVGAVVIWGLTNWITGSTDFLNLLLIGVSMTVGVSMDRVFVKYTG